MIESDRTKISREKQLLLCCTRTRVADEAATRIRDLLAQPLDWPCFLGMAANHSLRPLVQRNLLPFAGLTPPESLAQLNQDCRANSLKSLMLSAELCKILDTFRATNVAALPYKGPVLAVQAYGNVALREFGDLDIILRHKDLETAHSGMLALGYRPKFPWIHSEEVNRRFIPGEYAYIGSRNALVELHTERTLRHFPSPPNLDPAFARLAAVLIDGREVLTFSSEDLLSFLCVHGSKDLWERIAWVADIAELLQNSPNFNWDGAMRIASELRVQRMLFIGILLACDLAGLCIPKPIFQAARADRVAQRVAKQIGIGLLGSGANSLNAVRRFRLRTRMVEGNIPGFRYALCLTATPAEEDLNAHGEPFSIGPLQSLARPFRLIRKFRPAQSAARTPLA